jgi:hypothetical protein
LFVDMATGDLETPFTAGERPGEQIGRNMRKRC